MKRAAPWLIALAAVALVALSWIPRDPDSMRPWQGAASTYSPGAEGTKAFYLLLGQLGLELRRSRLPAYAELPAASVLWTLGREPFGRMDRRELLRFIERGGTLVAPPQALAGVLEVAGAGPCRSESLTDEAATLAVDPSKLELAAAPTFISGCRAPDRVHAALDNTALVAHWNIGEGRAVSLGLDELVRNQGIARAENGIFLARLALDLGHEHVFDEFVTGFGEGNWASLLARVPYRAGLAQLALALALAVWALVPRRWPAEPRAPERRRRTLDHVEAVARLWQRTGDAGLPLEAILKGLDDRARGRAGQLGASPFLARIDRLHPNLSARAREVWHNAERLSREPRPPPETVRRAVIDLESLEWEISKPWVKRPAE